MFSEAKMQKFSSLDEKNVCLRQLRGFFASTDPVCLDFDDDLVLDFGMVLESFIRGSSSSCFVSKFEYLKPP